MKTLADEHALGAALEWSQDRILIGEPLSPRIERLYTMNHLLWYVCMAGLAVAAAALIKMKPRQDIAFPKAMGLVSGSPGALAVGKDTMATAALVASHGGGVQALRRLRKDYSLGRVEPGMVLLTRKNIQEGNL